MRKLMAAVVVLWFALAGAARAGNLVCQNLGVPISLGGVPGGSEITDYTAIETGCTGGTFGTAVFDQAGELLMLTNSHVAARRWSNGGNPLPTDLIVQPNLTYQSCGLNPYTANWSRLGRTYLAVPLKQGSTVSNLVDAALIKPLVPGQIRTDVCYIGKSSAVPVIPNGLAAGTCVQKYGGTTGYTRGKLQFWGLFVTITNTPNVVEKANTLTYGMAGGEYRFANQVSFVTATAGLPFASQGDSGSMVYTCGLCPQPIGLIFSGDLSANGSGAVYANLIGAVEGSWGSFGNIKLPGGCSVSAVAEEAQAEAQTGNPLIADSNRANHLVQENHDQLWVKNVQSVNVGLSEDGQQVVIAVFVTEDQYVDTVRRQVPAYLEGVPVVVKGPIVAHEL